MKGCNGIIAPPFIGGEPFTGGALSSDLKLETTADFLVYGLDTDDSNYERLKISFDGTYNRIASEAAGTGTQRGLELDAASWLALKLGDAWFLALYQNQVRLSKTLGNGGLAIDIGTSSDPFRHGYFEKLTIDSLPTSDPSVSGQLWNDSGTVKVSA